MQKWMAEGMKGDAPYSQGQLQDAKQGAVKDAATAAQDGAKVTPQPVQRTGSLLGWIRLWGITSVSYPVALTGPITKPAKPSQINRSKPRPPAPRRYNLTPLAASNQFTRAA